MKTYLICAVFLFVKAVQAQRSEPMIGELSVDELKETDQTEWFMKNYRRYSPDKKKVEALKNALPDRNVEFKVFFGTWCPDSRREVPRIVKIFDRIGLEEDRFSLIGVNQFKELPKAYAERSDKINLDRVPTLIYYKNDEEVNRYVEFARVSLLEDLLLIVQEEDYKHSYYTN